MVRLWLGHLFYWGFLSFLCLFVEFGWLGAWFVVGGMWFLDGEIFEGKSTPLF